MQHEFLKQYQWLALIAVSKQNRPRAIISAIDVLLAVLYSQGLPIFPSYESSVSNTWFTLWLVCRRLAVWRMFRRLWSWGSR